MTLRATLYAGPSEHQQRVMRGLLASLTRDGWRVSVRPPTRPEPADLAVMWGHRRHSLMEAQRQRGLPYLIAERAYVGDRFFYTSLGYNGLNGRADFDHEHITDPARWQAHFSGEMHPPRSGAGDYALLIGQVPRDAALSAIPEQNLDRWIEQMRDEIPRRLGLPVRYRPHPQVTPSTTTLDDDLARAAVCVTYNSNSGVIAALRGVPVVAMDPGSMAWPVAAHSLDEPLVLPDRSAWAARLAWTQWTPDEIANGTAWAHLRTRWQPAAHRAAA